MKNKKIEYVDLLTTIEEELRFNVNDFAFLKLLDVYSDYVMTSDELTHTHEAKGVFFALKESANTTGKWRICGNTCEDYMMEPFEFIRSMHNITGIGLKFRSGEYVHIGVPYIELSPERPYNILQRSGTYTNGELVVEIRSSESASSVFDEIQSGCIADEVSMEEYYTNTKNDLYSLRIPRNEFERECLAKRILSEADLGIFGDNTGFLREYSKLTDDEKEIEDSKSHDYLNWSIDFDDLGMPRNPTEYALFSYRHSVEYDDYNPTKSYDFGDFPPSDKEGEIVRAFYSGKITKDEARKELDRIPSWE